MVFRKLIKKLYSTKNTVCDPLLNGEYKLLERIIKKESTLVLFDIGGNNGDYSDKAIQLCEKNNKEYFIHIFEPQHNLFIKLQDKFKCNINVAVNNVAASNKSDTADLFGINSHASLYFRNDIHLKEQKKTVQLITLDCYTSENNINRASLIKIDTEGSEYDVLIGMKTNIALKTFNYIQFEYGGTFLDAKHNLKEIYSLLEHDYNIGKILPEKIHFTKYKRRLEDFKYSNYIARAHQINNHK